jgi:hypothetical protein
LPTAAIIPALQQLDQHLVLTDGHAHGSVFVLRVGHVADGLVDLLDAREHAQPKRAPFG